MDNPDTHVKDKQRVLSGHDLGWAVAWNLESLFVPPFVTSLGPGNGFSGPLEDKNVFNHGALIEGGIDDSFSSNGLSASSTLVRGDQNAGLAIHNTVSK